MVLREAGFEVIATASAEQALDAAAVRVAQVRRHPGTILDVDDDLTFSPHGEVRDRHG